MNYLICTGADLCEMCILAGCKDTAVWTPTINELFFSHKSETLILKHISNGFNGSLGLSGVLYLVVLYKDKIQKIQQAKQGPTRSKENLRQ